MPSSRKISRSSKPSAQSLKATPSARRTLIPKPPSLTPLGSARVSADGPDTMENRDLWSCSKDGSTSTPQNTAPLSPTQSHLCESDSPLKGRVGRGAYLFLGNGVAVQLHEVSVGIARIDSPARDEEYCTRDPARFR